MRNETIQIRVTNEEKEAYLATAKSNDFSLSDWVRDCLEMFIDADKYPSVGKEKRELAYKVYSYKLEK